MKRLEYLKDSEFNRRYWNEIVSKYQTNQRNQERLILDWLVDKDEMVTFTITVTFKNLVPYEATDGYKKAARYEYEKRVLTKVMRRLCRTSSKWNRVLPIHLFVYEYEQGSFFKPVPPSNQPHHIHGMFSVPKELAQKIYHYDLKQMDSRLKKDILSISKVSTVYIEPLLENESDSWMNYMLKDKDSFCFS
jgi:hypothetical protein